MHSFSNNLPSDGRQHKICIQNIQMYMSIIIRIDSFLYNFAIEINFAKLLAIFLIEK